MKTVFSIYFEEPFWVGVFETRADGELTVGRVVFGGEPSDAEVRDLLLYRYDTIPFSTVSLPEGETPHPVHANPKRRQRQAVKDQRYASSTKAQEALKAAYEASKADRRDEARRRTEDDELRKFLLRQEKKKRKRRGH